MRSTLTLGLLLVLLNLTACQLFKDGSAEQYNNHIPTEASPAATEEAPAEHWTMYSSDEVTLSIKVPPEWATYHSDTGIVLDERHGSVDSAVKLQGLLVHVFVPTTENFDFPDKHDANIAWEILSQVITKPEYVGDALVSNPVAFKWDHHDAAYYLLNNRDGTVTLLLALGLPDKHSLVVCHVSSPEDQADRIRDLLPDLLESLTVNGTPIDSTALHHLPDPLVFPVDDRP